MRIRSLIIPPQTLHRATVLAAALVLLAACGGAAVPQPVPSAPGSVPDGSHLHPAAAAAPADPFALPAGPRDDEAADPTSATPVTLDAWQKAKKAKGVAAPPAACAAYANRAPSKEPTDVLKAFGEKDTAKRDALLVALGKAPQASAAATRAQRADLAPVECADAIVDPFLEGFTAASTEKPELVRLVIGFSLAGKLARTASTPPAMGAIRDKDKVKAFISGPLKTWLLEQSTAIELLSSGAAGLSGYARGLAAIEAGIAEMRLVDKMRTAPVPADWDPELKAIYESALDEALEPRKKRGRDAALVGMSDLARVGILRDARLDRARVLLTKLYGGRRIDALDALYLPATAPLPSPETPKDVALAYIPIFWLDGRDFASGGDPRMLSRGVTRSVRDRFRDLAEGAPDELRTTYARTRFDMGRMFWRRVDFVEAARAAKGSPKPEDRLVLALSLALVRGPNGAAEMMRADTPAALDLKHTEALDALVTEGGPLAGMAAYDAAHLRALSPPDGDEALPHWRDVAARFRKAEALLTDPAHKKAAAQRATEIDAIAQVAAKKPTP